MKKDVAQFVANYMICQQAKTERKKPTQSLKPLPVPENRMT